jgi:branched-chain amino acid transport system substrate-binding protein
MSHHSTRFGSGGLILALAVAAMVGAAACQPTAPVPSPSSKGTLSIGVDLPESGPEAGQGLSTLNGVAFAVQRHGNVRGYRLTIENYDDAGGGEHNPDRGARNVQQMLANPHVLGAIGPFNASVAVAEIPVAGQGHLALISPATTNECLTRNGPQCRGLASQLRGDRPPAFFRVVTTDDLQGPALADFAIDTLKASSVAVANELEVYGSSLAGGFEAELARKGGKVVARATFDITSKDDFGAFTNAAKSAGAQAVLFGGTGGRGCALKAEMSRSLPSVPLLAGDALIQDGRCVEDPSQRLPQLYASVAAPYADGLASARPTIDAFHRAYKQPPDYGPYTIAAYDATRILIDAIGRAIDSRGGAVPDREDVRAMVASTSGYAGALGTSGFDSNGDTTLRWVAVYRAQPEGKTWGFSTQLSIARS